jgi:RsiW-degrading membrane proteinase PrsW (M82 family)
MKSLLPVVWGLAVSLGALWIRYCRPQENSALFQRMIDSEPVHVVAHSLIYGSLAWLSLRFFSAHRGVALVLVLGLGLLQELSQVLGLRAFGGPELFDLGVDLVAAGVVVALSRPHRRTCPR